MIESSPQKLATTLESLTWICPKCEQELPLARFARRTDGSPSWCRLCINRRRSTTRRRKQQKALNESLRRIRLNSPDKAVRRNLEQAVEHAGGVRKFGEHLAGLIQSDDIREMLRAVRIIMSMALLADREAAEAEAEMGTG